jgi:OOP family OmpA-OmpF porin
MGKAHCAALLALAITAAAGGAAAQSKPSAALGPHWYAGVAGAQTIFDIQPDSVPAPGATDSTLNSGQNQTGWRVFAGRRLNPWFAFEGALTDYGRFHATRDVQAPVGGSVDADVRVRGASVDLLVMWPFESGFTAIGKVGGMYARTQTDYKVTGPYAFPPDKQTSATNGELVGKYGIGLGYALTERVTLKMEYEVARKVGEEIEGDMKALFFSTQYRF